MDEQTHIPWVVAAVMGTFALVQTLRLVLRGRFSQLSRARRMRRALVGEAAAEKLLARRGFAVLARQARSTFSFRCDGAAYGSPLRADLLVSKRGRTFVAEVKTGELAPKLDHGPTRRQLLEYSLAFDVDGVLLVNADTNQIHEVEFPRPHHTATIAWIWLALGAAIGSLATYFAL